ncbi:MAG: hypothetical protein WC975_12960 [Phycisphaerae bacterium]
MNKVFLIILLVMVLPAGCAQMVRPIWEPADSSLVWPIPPDTPRIKYIGQLSSTQDIHPVKSVWEKLNETLTGRNHNHRLIAPKDVAVDQNKVFVTDPGQSGILVFDLERRKTSLIQNQYLRYPSHLALNSKLLFVSDALENSVMVFDHDGNFAGNWAKDVIKRPAGLCWCPANNRLYIVDVAGHCVVVLNDQGQIVTRFGKRGTAPGEFNFPVGIRFDEKLGLLITDSLNARIQRFTTDGKFISAFGQKGDAAGAFSLPKGLTSDREKHIYVIDNNFENVQIFDPAGRLLLSFGEEGCKSGQFCLPEGIFFDDQNRIWVADTFNRRLQLFQYLGSKDAPQ